MQAVLRRAKRRVRVSSVQLLGAALGLRWRWRRAAPRPCRGGDGRASRSHASAGHRSAGSRASCACPLEDYVAATVLSEVHRRRRPTRGVVERMFEVQAVIARTYAHGASAAATPKDGFDLCSTTHCQLYEPDRLRRRDGRARRRSGARAPPADALVRRTRRHARCYHADCGGHTSAATDVWGGTGSPVSPARCDDGPAARRAHGLDLRHHDADACARALNADPRTRVGARLDRIDDCSRRDDAGAARERVTLRGSATVMVRGEVSARCAVTRASARRACAARCSTSAQRQAASSSTGAASATASGCARRARWRGSRPARAAASSRTYFPERRYHSAVRPKRAHHSRHDVIA